MPKDEEISRKVQALFKDMPNPTDFAENARTFEALCKNSAIFDVISETQHRIAELGDENIHAVVTMVIAKDASECSFAYTPSIYETDSAYAMSLANITMLERMIHDEAEDYRMSLFEDIGEEDD